MLSKVTILLLYYFRLLIEIFSFQYLHDWSPR